MVLAFAAVSVAAAEAASSKELFARLRNLPQQPAGGFITPSAYYDMHGNPVDDLRALTIGRFGFTSEICDELGATDPRTHPEYVSALYGVLAKVCDPASIPWLAQRVAGAGRQEIYDYWLPRFGTGKKWQVTPEKWSEFFERWLQSDTAISHRTEIVSALSRLECLRTFEFFTREVGDATTSGRDLLIALRYRCEHGVAPDPARIREAIAQNGGSPESREVLLQYLTSLASEAAVPWLIEVVESQPEEKYGNAQWLLEQITFRRDVWGREHWQSWAAAHATENRERWMRDASAQVVALAKSDPVAAKAFLRKAVYRWCDPVMLPTMERLAEFKELRSEIVGWINLTYGYHPEIPQLRERLRALAEKIQKSGNANDLEEWARNLMKEWDFLYEDKTTWEGLNSWHVL